MLKNQIISELLANRESGVMKIEDDYELDSLAKLEVVAFLENIKVGFLDNCFDAVADAGSLDAILTVFDAYQIVSEVA